MSKFRFSLSIVFILMIFAFLTAEAAPGDTTADAVLGQANFTSNLPNGGGGVSASGINYPYGIAVYAQTGRLFAADYSNNRVLSWPNGESFTNGESADLVIGQNNFTSSSPNQGGSPAANTLRGPVGVAVDQRTGRLFVSDFSNHRVLSYPYPTANNPAADYVFGQPNFNTNTANNGGVDKDTLYQPWGVAFDSDSGLLYVADSGNNRVLEFGPDFNVQADNVFGQPNFTTNTPNTGGISNHSLFQPTGIAFEPDSTTLAVADTTNNRVLLFVKDISTTDAEFVLGQNGSFSSNTINNGGLGPKSLYLPTDVSFDSNRDLYVADRFNSRVLFFDLDLYNGADDSADQVFGQPNFTSNTPNNSGLNADSLYQPYAVTVTPNQNILVSDRNNYRILRYDRPQPYGQPDVQSIWPEQVIVGSQGFELLVIGNGFVPQSTVTWNGSSLNTTYLNPTHLLADVPASNVSTMFNAQIGVTNPAPGGGTAANQAAIQGYVPTANDNSADRILGRSNFDNSDFHYPGEMGIGPRTIRGSAAPAVDPVTGRVYVSDHFQNRILSWPSAEFVNSTPADLVIGQSNFYDSNPGINATSLFFPTEIAIDTNSNLYVTDTANNRVLVFQDPSSSDTVADFVFGQPNFTSNSGNNGGISANSLFIPTGIEIGPDGTTYVSDYGNHRILIFFNPLTTDRTADVVLGQVDFTSSDANQGNANPSATSLNKPTGLALDGDGRLYVADYNNNRALAYSPPFINGKVASFVFGQPDFNSSTPNNGGISAESLDSPWGIAVDSANTVFIADTTNNRVLAYDEPVPQNDKTADEVFGQPDFTSNTPNPGGVSAETLYGPLFLNVDSNDNLFVVDTYNARILVYERSLQGSYTVFLPAVIR